MESYQLADSIADLLWAIEPYFQGKQLRAKVDFSVLENVKIKIRNLALEAGIDFEPGQSGYPHFYYLDDSHDRDWVNFEIGGESVRSFVNVVFSSDVEALQEGQSQPTSVHTSEGDVQCVLSRKNPGEFVLSVPGEQSGLVGAWLRDLSDGYIKFDADIE